MLTEKKKAKWMQNGFILAVLAYPLLHFLVFYVYINSSSFVMAFQKVNENYDFVWNGLNNFKEVFSTLFSEGSLISVAMINNLKMFFWTTVIGFPLNIVFSYYLYKKKFGSSLIRFIVMLPSIISGMVMSLLFLKFTETALPELMKNYFGITTGSLLQQESTAFGMNIFYVLWTGFTQSLILYPNAMNAIDDGVIESALLDGANQLQEVWYIIVPLIYPTITTFFVTGVAALFTLSGPLYAFYYTNAPSHTWTMGYYLFVQTVHGKGTVTYPYMSAIGLVLTLITVPLVMGVKTLMEKCDPMN